MSTFAPSSAPIPSYAPSSAPSYAPSSAPSSAPSYAPTDAPTYAPTDAPTYAPTDAPMPDIFTNIFNAISMLFSPQIIAVIGLLIFVVLISLIISTILFCFLVYYIKVIANKK